ncbi:hypothetical protein D7V95_03975 [bacterium J10(2018)]|nr:hypothetical protein D7V95_03975 [bacterium J10(2018)]
MDVKTLIEILAAILSATAVLSCSHVDDDRIPAVGVNIALDNPGYWNTFGVHALGQYRYFIKNEGIPSEFHYTALTFTGFGGVLLVTDIYNQPLAYDLACPVEMKPTVRISYNPDNLRARCSSCGSEYDVSEFNGSPVSGAAYEKKYGLRRYRVIPSSSGGYNIVF